MYFPTKTTPVSSQHFSCCSVLNPAALHPAPADGDGHNHLSVTEQPLAPLHNLRDVPLQKPDIILFIDGSCPHGSTGHPAAGCAVRASTNGLEAYSLPTISLAQIVELLVLTHASVLAEGQSATVYTSSPYAFGVVNN